MSPDQDSTAPRDNPALDDGSCSGWDNAECEGTPYCPPRCPRFFDITETPLLVEPPTEEDWDRLIAMYDTIDATAMGLPPATSEKLERWLDHLRRNGWNLVARQDDQLVGHISVTPADATAPEFVVFVHDRYHGRGIGTELVKQAIAYAADKGHEALKLTVEPGNRPAISIYTNVGFEIVDSDVDLRMRLPLDEPIAETVRLPPGERSSFE